MTSGDVTPSLYTPNHHYELDKHAPEQWREDRKSTVGVGLPHQFQPTLSPVGSRNLPRSYGLPFTLQYCTSWILRDSYTGYGGTAFHCLPPQGGALLILVDAQGTSIQPHSVVKAQVHHPGDELHHLFMVTNSSGDVAFLAIHFGSKARFIVDMDGPSFWIRCQKCDSPQLANLWSTTMS